MSDTQPTAPADLVPQKFLVIDTETSGLSNFKLPADHPEQPWLAELAMIRVDENLQIESEHIFLVKPDGWVLSEEAARVNGLTMERLEAEGTELTEVLFEYTKAIREGRAVIAHNAQYDCKIMRGMLRRRGLDDLFEETPNFCTMRKSIGFVIKADGKKGWPKLSDCCAHFKIPQAEQHSAIHDARSCLETVRWLKKLGVEITPEVHNAKEGHPARQQRDLDLQKPKEEMPY